MISLSWVGRRTSSVRVAHCSLFILNFPLYNPPMAIYSYSRINTYFTCPAQFQFRYIEKRPSSVAEGVELFLGSRFHETMEHLYQQVPQRVPTVNELVDYFKNHWEKHWREALQKQKTKNFKDTLRVVQESQTVEDYFQKGLLDRKSTRL